jgi:hypothetical protein
MEEKVQTGYIDSLTEINTSPSFNRVFMQPQKLDLQQFTRRIRVSWIAKVRGEEERIE